MLSMGGCLFSGTGGTCTWRGGYLTAVPWVSKSAGGRGAIGPDRLDRPDRLVYTDRLDRLLFIGL